MMRNSCLYEGTMFHKRFGPKQHQLRYRVFNLLVDLDELEQVEASSPFVSINGFNLVSFHEKDHGNPDDQSGASLKHRILALLHAEGIETSSISRISALAYPRILGFAFNPLTVFYCLSDDGTYKAVIYEVRNTFGERHNYIFEVPENTSLDTSHATEKRFHVSPFFDLEGTYTFRLKPPGERTSVVIDYTHQGNKRLTASFTGQRRHISTRSILGLTARLPFMTVKVVAGILWEALILWLKGLRVFSHSTHHPWQSSRATALPNRQHSPTTKISKEEAA